MAPTPTVTPVLAQGISSAANLGSSVGVFTDALSHATSIALDSAGQPTQIFAGDGGVENFTYDSNFNQTTVVDPLGRNTQTAYDAYGLPTSVIQQDGSTVTMAYDPTLHEITSSENALGLGP